jgi:hypothetical protein
MKDGKVHEAMATVVLWQNAVRHAAVAFRNAIGDVTSYAKPFLLVRFQDCGGFGSAEHVYIRDTHIWYNVLDSLKKHDASRKTF